MFWGVWTEPEQQTQVRGTCRVHIAGMLVGEHTQAPCRQRVSEKPNHHMTVRVRARVSLLPPAAIRDASHLSLISALSLQGHMELLLNHGRPDPQGKAPFFPKP